MMLTTADLESRGWTRGMITKYASPPDRVETYSGRRIRGVRYLYRTDRIEMLEGCESVARELERSRSRRAVLAANKDERTRAANERRARKLAELNARLDAEISAHTPLTDSEAVLALALKCMHALNRWAKHPECKQTSTIYATKNRFLAALVGVGRARVERYSWTHEYMHDWRDDRPYTVLKRWYVVCIDQYRFHQPEESATHKMKSIAKPCEPHDPTQPAREVPDVGLSVACQLRVVALATEQLEGKKRAA